MIEIIFSTALGIVLSSVITELVVKLKVIIIISQLLVVYAIVLY